NLDGTGMKNVTRFRDTAFYATGATMSVDGSLIAFTSNYAESGAQQSNQIWVIQPDGTGLRRISTGPEAASDPSISGDGGYVVYAQGGQLYRSPARAQGIASSPLTVFQTSSPSTPALSEDASQFTFALSPVSGPPAAVYTAPLASIT